VSWPPAAALTPSSSCEHPDGVVLVCTKCGIGVTTRFLDDVIAGIAQLGLSDLMFVPPDMLGLTIHIKEAAP
jgi:hypothetical protein